MSLGRGEIELGEDVVARALIGGGRDSDARHTGKELFQAAKRAIIGPEVMPPLADAVRFVDGDERDIQPRDALAHAIGERFRRDIEHVHLAARRRFQRRRLFLIRHGRVEPFGPYTKRLQRIDLVRHQRDQRGDDEADTGPQDGRNLVAERLAAAGRQHGQDILAGHDISDHRVLQTAKRVIAIDPFEKVQRRFIGRQFAGSAHLPDPAGSRDLPAMADCVFP